MKQETNKGFTLIELMIVVVILGVLAAITIPQFNSYRAKSFNVIALKDLKNIMLSEEVYFVNNLTYVNLSTIAGYQETIPNLAGLRISSNVCAKVTNASSTDFSVQTENLNGNKTYSNSQSSSLTTTSKSKGAYSIGC